MLKFNLLKYLKYEDIIKFTLVCKDLRNFLWWKENRKRFSDIFLKIKKNSQTKNNWKNPKISSRKEAKIITLFYDYFSLLRILKFILKLNTHHRLE